MHRVCLVGFPNFLFLISLSWGACSRTESPFGPGLSEHYPLGVCAVRMCASILRVIAVVHDCKLPLASVLTAVQRKVSDPVIGEKFDHESNP